MQRLVGLITVNAIICVLILANLHSFWTPLAWLFGIAIWAYYFWWERVDPAAAIKQIRNIYQETFLSVATLHRENTPESSP